MVDFNAITKAAQNEGKARAVVVALVKSAGDTPEVRAAYILGRMAHSLGVNAGDARLCLDKKGYGAKTDAPARTETEEKAYGAARVAWDSVKRAAGIAASPKKSGARKGALTPKGTGQDAKANDAPVSIAALSVPRAKGVEGVQAYAMLLCGNIRKFQSTNSAAFTGDDGAFYRDTLTAFVAAVEGRAVKK